MKLPPLAEPMDAQRFRPSARMHEEDPAFSLDLLPLPGLIADRNWEIQRVNAGWESITGWSATDSCGIPLLQFVKPVDASRMNRFSAGLENPGSRGTTRLSIDVRSRDGTEIPMEMAVRWVSSDPKLPARFLCLFTDLREQKVRLEELRLAVGREREQRQGISQFAAMIAHEFRTPASNIAHAAEILGQQPGAQIEARLNRYLRLISENAFRLNRLADQLSLSARFGSGKWSFTPTDTDVGPLCRSVVEEFEPPDTLNRRIRFEGPTTELRFRVDAMLIRIALSNLLSNALNYSPPDSPVNLRIQSSGERLEITIADSGIGIRPEDAHRLFHPFQRGSNVGSTKGNGLGLAIARECVEIHRGTLHWNRRTPSGTEFTLQLTAHEPL